jgi:hypothetical protein
MKLEQKIVAIGAACGIVTLALSVWSLTNMLPSPGITAAFGDHLPYALPANIFAIAA